MRRIALVAGALCVSACTLLLGFEDGHERTTTLLDGDGGTPAEAGIVTGDVVVSPATVDFGNIVCGESAPAPRPIEIKNTGPRSAKFSAELTGSPSFSIVGASQGDIAAGATATITVATTAVTSDAAGEVILAVGGELVHVQLRAASSGAALRVSPPTCDFGPVRVDTDAIKCPVVLSNVGQDPATVGLPSATAPFTLTWDTSPSSIAPDASVTGTVAYHPTSAAPSTQTFPFVAASKLCGGPLSLTAKGTGSNDPVLVQPGTLEFGNMPCGTSPPARTVTVQNFNATAITYSAPVLTGGATSAFTVPGGGTVNPDAGATISVKPKLVSGPPGPISDAVVITTNGAGDSPHTVPIHATAQGAVLAFVPSTAYVFDFPVTKVFSVANNGNSPVTVKVAIGGTIELPAPFTVTSPTTAQTIPAGGTLSGQVKFATTTAGTYEADLIVLVTAGSVCGATPTVHLTGTK